LSVGDLTSFKYSRQFRAILCRGVLNDFLTDKDPERLTRQFAGLLILAPSGVLLLDVRRLAENRGGQRRALAHTA
jgi:hypothetical protein